jgi:hypothetical protein
MGSPNGHESTIGQSPIGHLWAVSIGRQQKVTAGIQGNAPDEEDSDDDHTDIAWL